jgi:hypothetical protein
VGTSLGFTSLGELAHGEGKIAIFGAILPTQNESDPHLFGLADYAPSVAGGQVLHTMLEYGNNTVIVIIETAVTQEEARLLRQATALAS